MGIPSLSFNQDTLCQLLLDDELAIQVRRKDSDTLDLIGLVGDELPDIVPAALAQQMAIQAFSPIEGKPGFGMIDEDDLLVVYHTLSVAELSLQDFLEIFGQFVETVDIWRSFLQRASEFEGWKSEADSPVNETGEDPTNPVMWL